jgi:hypothetical protein
LCKALEGAYLAQTYFSISGISALVWAALGGVEPDKILQIITEATQSAS